MTDAPLHSLIAQAAALLRAGRLVAFPTETVYGLGADATSAEAVARIFAAKGRPATNPLIVHVADAAVAQRYAAAWPDAADALARRFWPGPLTIVVPKAVVIPAIVTAGRDTVGLRVPSHPLALELLRAFAGPVAAPSANRSTRISPTTAQHVAAELGDRVDLVLDGGPCTVGIESTVLDLSHVPARILRPGGISRDQIEALIGQVDMGHLIVDTHAPAASPGQHRIHYAPRALAIRFDRADVSAVLTRRSQVTGPMALMTVGPAPEPLSAMPWGRTIEMPAAPREYARALYARLRELDEAGVGTIFVEMPPDEPAWHAVRDRLTRATRPL